MEVLEGGDTTFATTLLRLIYFWGYTNSIEDMARTGKPEATHHCRILELPRQS